MDGQSLGHVPPLQNETQSFYWIPPKAIVTVNDTYAWCERFVRSLGYDYFFFIFFVPLTPRRKVEVLSTNYPIEWRRRYDDRGYIEIDPIAAAVMRWSRPFTWRSIQHETCEQAEAFWADAKQHGLHDGLVVPVRGVAGGKSYLVMAGHEVPEDHDIIKAHFGSAMGFLCELGEQVFEQLTADRWQRWRGSSSLLTARQVEVLQLLATGLTVKEAARQLHISPRAVQHAMERILTRLGVSGTLEAKFSAWTLGLIGPRMEPIDIADIDKVIILER